MSWKQVATFKDSFNIYNSYVVQYSLQSGKLFIKIVQSEHSSASRCVNSIYFNMWPILLQRVSHSSGIEERPFHIILPFTGWSVQKFPLRTFTALRKVYKHGEYVAIFSIAIEFRDFVQWTQQWQYVVLHEYVVSRNHTLIDMGDTFIINKLCFVITWQMWLNCSVLGMCNHFCFGWRLSTNSCKAALPRLQSSKHKFTSALPQWTALNLS